MNTKITFLAALLLAGVSQAALAQDHDRGDRDARPVAQGHGGERAPAHGQAASPQAHPAQPQPSPGGHWRYNTQPQPAPGPAPGPAPTPTPGRDAPRPHDRGPDRGPGRNGVAPLGAPPSGDRHWDRQDAPREAPRPDGGERGWDREHDGHAGDARALQHDGRGDGRWDRDRDRRDRDRWDHDRDNWPRWERDRFPPVYSAPRRYRIDPYRRPYGYYVRSWGFGDILPRGWYGQGYWVDNFFDYGLPWPPPGYHWVRVGFDVLLVDDYSGRVMQVVRDIFW